jgi:hypothetical protein
MEDTEVEVLLSHEMPYTREEGLPQRPIIGPFREDAVDIGVMESRLALSVCGDGEALPLHPGIEDPEDEVKDAMIA